MKHLVSVADLTREDVLHLFEVAAELKTRRKAGDLATPLAGRSLARIHAVWIGDGNNVCHSFLLMGALLGCRLTAACPAGYGPSPEVLALVRRLGGRVEVTPDPRAAATGADVLYTDVWTSMGQEAEQARRREVFR